MSWLTLAAKLATLAMPAAAATTYVGCVMMHAMAPDLTMTSDFGPLDWCRTQCNTPDAPGRYMLWGTADAQMGPEYGVCSCSVVGPQRLTPEQGDAGASPWGTGGVAPNGQCDFDMVQWGAGGYLVEYLTDDRTFHACASSTVPVGRTLTPAAPTAGECLAACDGWNYATLNFANDECTCMDYMTYTPAACGPDTTDIWRANGLPEASLIARRRRALASDRAARERDTLCPAGLTACRVAQGGVECLDTGAELESCGGCVQGNINGAATGQDCTALPGAHPHAITCHHGQCVVTKCRYGWKLVGNACVRQK